MSITVAPEAVVLGATCAVYKPRSMSLRDVRRMLFEKSADNTNAGGGASPHFVTAFIPSTRTALYSCLSVWEVKVCGQPGPRATHTENGENAKQGLRWKEGVANKESVNKRCEVKTETPHNQRTPAEMCPKRRQQLFVSRQTKQPKAPLASLISFILVILPLMWL